jgi:hypothetical protein
MRSGIYVQFSTDLQSVASIRGFASQSLVLARAWRRCHLALNWALSGTPASGVSGRGFESPTNTWTWI